MASLAGKVISLTGGASGIGLATAKLLAARGASLCIGDLNKEKLDSVVADLKKSTKNDKIKAFQLDVRDRANVRAFFEETKSQFGRLDACANIAGAIGKNMNIHHIWELDSTEYQFIMDVNSGGIFNCLAEALKPGVLSEGGSIVNAASICGIKGLERSSAYCASKHAVIGLTRAAAIEAGARGIRVNCIAPGVIETPMLASSNVTADTKAATPFTPLPRNGKPEEVGEAFAFLLGDESSFVSGSIVPVDGGWNAI